MTAPPAIDRQTGRKPDRWRPIALDGGYGWLVVLGSFLIHVFADGFVYSFGVIGESIVKEFGASNAETSFILSLLTGLMLAAGPIASAVSNKIGCRLTTIGGALIASAGCALSYFATSLAFLTFSVGIVMGFGFGMMYCPAIMIVTMYFERLRSLATGITVCGAGVGTFLFSKIISYLIVHFDWRTVFLIYAFVVLLCVPCGALYRPIEFEPIYDETAEDDDANKRDVKSEKREPIKTQETSRDTQNNANHLVPPTTVDKRAINGGIRAAVSHDDISTRPADSNLHRVRSLGEHLPHVVKSTGARVGDRAHISESLGYLNVPDVFCPRTTSEFKTFDAKMHSVHSLPSAQKKPASVLHQLSDVSEDEDTANEDTSASNSSRAIAFWRALQQMTNLALLTNPVYVLFGVSNFFTSVGFNGPPMFMPMNAEIVLRWSKLDAASTVAAYGIANTAGRIFFGLFCDRALPCRYGKDRARNRLWVYNWTLMLCGVASCFVFMMNSYWAFVSYCFFFGFTISSYVCLTSVVLVDLIGMEGLTNAFGLLLLIQGIATFVGPPIAGVLYDWTKRYDWTFGFCGVCLFISGLMMFVVPFMQQQPSSTKVNDAKLEQAKPQKQLRLVKQDSDEQTKFVKQDKALTAA